MNFLELVRSRYSVRSYSERDVEQKKLDYILECARLSPSACNRQPWHIHIVRRGAQFDSLCQSAERFGWLKSANIILAISADDSVAWHRGLDNHNHADIDCAIITEHITLAAAEQGLGSCWICAFDPEKANRALHLEPPMRCVAILPIGYPEGEPTPKIRKTIEQITSCE